MIPQNIRIVLRRDSLHCFTHGLVPSLLFIVIDVSKFLLLGIAEAISDRVVLLVADTLVVTI